MPADVLRRVLAAAGDDLVLIGGQALAFWMRHYQVPIPEDVPAVSRDADFLAQGPADRNAVNRMARALGGRSVFPNEHALTALVGQAVRPIGAEAYLNVDLLFCVHGTTVDRVRGRSVAVELEGVSFRVMHPMHVLKSRLDNLYGLRNKQNDVGVMQLSAALEVARQAQVALADPGLGGQAGTSALRYATYIAKLARTDAGRKVARRYGIHVADAIEPTCVREDGFHREHWPRLRTFLSETRAGVVPQREGNVALIANGVDR